MFAGVSPYRRSSIARDICAKTSRARRALTAGSLGLFFLWSADAFTLSKSCDIDAAAPSFARAPVRCSRRRSKHHLLTSVELIEQLDTRCYNARCATDASSLSKSVEVSLEQSVHLCIDIRNR